MALSQYALDHDGHYPDGKSSTEVFQQLLDGGYITDPAIFYVGFLHLPGKVPPQGTRLKAENVCWDVTAPVDSSDPEKLPIVFPTGYKITYQAGSAAVLLASPVPAPPRTWIQWLRGTPEALSLFTAVCYKDGSARALWTYEGGSIPNFIPTDFDAKGKTYRQLTP